MNSAWVAAEADGEPEDRESYQPIGSSEWLSESFDERGGEFMAESLEQDCQSLFLARFCLAMSPRYPEEIENIHKTSSLYFHMSTAYAIFLQLVNCLIQVGITYILLLDVEKEENTVESSYFQSHYDVSLAGATKFLTGIASPKEDPHAAAAVPKGIMAQCVDQTQYGLRHLSFYYFMIFVWITKMFHEALVSTVLSMRVFAVQNPAPGQDKTEGFSYFDVDRKSLPGPQVQSARARLSELAPDMSSKKVKKDTKSEDRSFNIIYLTRKMKAIIVMSILLWRFFVCIMITYAGCKFIMLQKSYEKVILKALCMQWVIQIDELLVKSFTTTATKELIGKVKLYHKRFVHVPWWEHGVGGISLFSIGAVGVLVVTKVFFGDLMDFRSECLRVTGVGYKMPVAQEFVHELSGLFH